MTASQIVASQKGQRRAARRERQKETAKRLSSLVDQGPTLGHGILADASISRETLKDYVRRLDEFWEYAEAEEMPLRSPGECDAALSRLCNHLYSQGELAHEGEKLKAAWEAAFPDYSKNGSLHLPLMGRTLKGWRRMAPSSTRYPVPEEGADLISMRLIERGRRDQALWVQVGLSTYLRPSENMRIAVGDLIPPIRQQGHALGEFSLMIAPLEREILTKTRGFDEAISLDDRRSPWLGAALQKLQERRRQELRATGMKAAEIEKQPLWKFKYSTLRDHYREAARASSILWMTDSPYALRHAGASRDVLLKARSLQDIQRRGRWGHINSTKHYEKHGRLQWLLQRMGEARVAEAHRARQRFRSLFLVG